MPDAATLDAHIHHPARLRIFTALAAAEYAAFPALQAVTGLTAGNLGSHLKSLEQVGYVESRRGFVDLRPRVRYRLTATGRDALRRYLSALEAATRALGEALERTRL
jgi:DNA-binding MarR family transcriptional regulator